MCIICRKEYNINTKVIYCCRNVKKIPKILINLKTLNCRFTYIRKIPKILINLKTLNCRNSQIKFIPETLIKLEHLLCNKYVLVSPQTYIIEPNNKKYLTFARCQARYKNKLRRTAALRKLKFAYDPKYIIGHNTKKQLARLFQN
jgi:hypothetical protein